MDLVINDFGHERDILTLFTWNVTAFVDTDQSAVTLILFLAFSLLFLSLGLITILSYCTCRFMVKGLKFDFMRLAHEFPHEMLVLFEIGICFAEVPYC